jgi:hypothetical protein
MGLQIGLQAATHGYEYGMGASVFTTPECRAWSKTLPPANAPGSATRSDRQDHQGAA